jgi:hypothetical protein
MIVRELVAKLGIDFDDRGARTADSKINALAGTFGKLVKMAGAYVGVQTFMGMVNEASKVEETLNVVTQTFGESTDEVLRWAKTSGEAMGRSEYSMREYASALGAVLAPTLGNKKAAAEMSQTMAGLAVDLASFFNKEDEETLERLRSGMLGSSEAVDQLGINLRVESLQAFASAQGITKSYKAMSEAEKVQLRFRKIMADTIDKQGDAARTGGGWANQTKRLSETFKDLRITVGNAVLGPFTKVVAVMGRAASAFGEMVKKSNIVQTALVALGVVAAGFAVAWALANLPLLLAVAGIALIVVAVEDLITGLEGGQSVIREFFEELIGKQGWANVMQAWKSAKEALGRLLSGEGTAGEVGAAAIGVPAALTGHSPEKMAAKERESGIALQRTKEANTQAALSAAPSSPWASFMEMLGSDPAKILAAEHASGLKLAEQQKLGARGSLGLPATGAIPAPTINITVKGNATPDTVREMERTGKRLMDDANRNMLYTTGAGG